MPKLSYKDAISEALVQAMAKDPNVFIMGEGVSDLTGIFGTTLAASRKFPKRVIDMPLSEALITGAGTGASLAGMRPVMVHARNDFLYLAMDQIMNHAALWSEMHGGGIKIPWVLRAIVGRGWGNGAQHSQSLQALFAHIPGLKVVMPANAYRAKGLLLAAIQDDSPIIFIEHKSLYHQEAEVPEKYYTLPLDQGEVMQTGKDITLVAISSMVEEAKKASIVLKQEGIGAEILDVSSVKPLDEKLILDSVRKTGRAIVLDTGWKSFGASAEIAALISEKVFGKLKAPVKRIALPDRAIPAGPALEQAYFPEAEDIVKLALDLCGRKSLLNNKIRSKNIIKISEPF